MDCYDLLSADRYLLILVDGPFSIIGDLWQSSLCSLICTNSNLFSPFQHHQIPRLQSLLLDPTAPNSLFFSHFRTSCFFIVLLLVWQSHGAVLKCPKLFFHFITTSWIITGQLHIQQYCFCRNGTYKICFNSVELKQLYKVQNKEL